jgi:UbiD family decarboxylase
MNAYWPTLGKYVEGLEKAGKLVRITSPVNKDTELHPLVRLQFRGLPESQRKAFLFENVVDGSGRRYDIPVLVGALAGSAEIYALGMGCELDQIEEVWRNALAHQIAPVVVGDAPCQEVVISGAELSQAGHGLGRLPIPISTPGFDNAPYTTAGHWVTKDPETGMHNLGNYRGMVKAEDRIGVLLGRLAWGMRWHIDRWRERGAKRVPAAIVIGVPPHVSYAAVTRIPNDMCEYDVAGGFVGRPLELIRCVTQDLLVPAQAEIVIEGTVPTDMVEMEGAFGEFPGYMAQRDYSFFMDVTAITTRKKPIYLSIISQMPPSESSKMRNIGRAAAGIRLLRSAGMDNVIAVEYLECAGSNAVAVVKLKKREPDDGKKALRLLAEKFMGKLLVAVDEDINIKDAGAALSRHRGGRGAPVHARSGRRSARGVARAGDARRAAAIDRAPHRRHHALALSAAVAAQARVHGARHRDMAGPAAAGAQSEGTLVGLLAGALDAGRGARSRARGRGPSLRDRREAEADAPPLRGVRRIANSE